jgi:hypothetical protein
VEKVKDKVSYDAMDDVVPVLILLLVVVVILVG